MDPDSDSKDPRPAAVPDRGTLVVIMRIHPIISKRRKWSSQENKMVIECYLLSESKVKGYRKRMLRLWLNKGMFQVSEQRLIDQANVFTEIVG